jgi:hypothetical protein
MKTDIIPGNFLFWFENGNGLSTRLFRFLNKNGNSNISFPFSEPKMGIDILVCIKIKESKMELKVFVTHFRIRIRKWK